MSEDWNSFGTWILILAVTAVLITGGAIGSLITWLVMK